MPQQYASSAFNKNGRLAGTVTVTGSTVIFVPQRAFQSGDNITVTVPTTVQSTSGASLPSPHVYQFTTAAEGPGQANFIWGNYADFNGGETGDFDEGGFPDLITQEPLDNRLRVLFNNGQQFYGGFSVGKVAVGDIDGDADLDVLVAGKPTGIITALLNTGNALFTATTVLPASTIKEEIQLGDLDSDGDLDIVVTSQPASGTGSTIQTHLNNGNGSFSAGQSVALSTSFVERIALGDMDEDGDLDIVVSDLHTTIYASGLIVLLNNGEARFTALPRTERNTANTASDALVLAAADADGDLDVSVSGRAFSSPLGGSLPAPQ